MGTKHGPVMEDRPTRYTTEERRAKHLARVRRGYPEANARKREKKRKLMALKFPNQA